MGTAIGSDRSELAATHRSTVFHFPSSNQLDVLTLSPQEAALEGWSAEGAVEAFVNGHGSAIRSERREPMFYKDVDDFIAVSIASLPSWITDAIG